MKIDFGNQYRLVQTPNCWKVQKLRRKKRLGKRIVEAKSITFFPRFEEALQSLRRIMADDPKAVDWAVALASEEISSILLSIADDSSLSIHFLQPASLLSLVDAANDGNLEKLIEELSVSVGTA